LTKAPLRLLETDITEFMVIHPRDLVALRRFAQAQGSSGNVVSIGLVEFVNSTGFGAARSSCAVVERNRLERGLDSRA
jgi:hypothetical protein